MMTSTGKLQRPQFKDKMGRWRTQSLFRETNYGTGDVPPIYTLKWEDPQGELPSVHKLYLDFGDLTEYDFALHVFGSWEHFKKLESLKWFREYLDKWRDELEIKVRSAALQKLQGQSQKSTSAAKFLAEGGWKGKRRGRPSKEEVERETKIAAGIEAELDDDAERVGLKVITS